jgi:hypothetical protein
MRRTIVIPTLLAAACATTPAPSPTPAATAPAQIKPAADLVDHSGDSPDTAIAVPRDAPNEGIDWMNNWIYDRYGRFRVQKRVIAHAGEGPAERRYRVLTVELPDGSTHQVFFDITENWKNWTPTSH